MTIRKLTLAAAISFGIMSMTIPAMANEASTTPADNSSLMILQKDVATSDGAIKDVSSCDPVEVPKQPLPVLTGPACPVAKSCEPCDPCQAKPACPVTGPACPICPTKPSCEPACPAPCPVAACPEQPKPACATCPSTSKDRKYFERQVYAYPSSIYGGNVAFSADPMAIGLSKESGVGIASGAYLDLNAANITGAAAPFYLNPMLQFGQGVSVTGSAAQLPCYADPSQLSSTKTGVGVNRDDNSRLGAHCPVTIQTATSMDITKKSLVPIEIQTGAAAPMTSMFDDVPSDFWASANINRLVASNVIAGYPDRTFKPTLPVSRAEFASLLINGLNMHSANINPCPIFNDVPNNHWANNAIDKGVNAGLIAGYPDNSFKPGSPVSRAEALTILAKSIKCEVNPCDVDKILSEYKDACDVPEWAKLSVAKALKSGLLKNTPAPDQILPNHDASRADIAAMLSELRIAIGLDTQPVACAPTGGAAMIEQSQVVAIPTLNIKFEDNITARANHTGDRFVAKTIDPVTINGVTYPSGSKVLGHIVEVIRPTAKEQGGLKLAFDEIRSGKDKASLPNQVLTAQVQEIHRQKGFTRLVQWPFVWTGSILGNVGRTVGSSVIIAGNAVEQVTSGVGVAAGELTQGKVMAAGRSMYDSSIALLRAPVDVTRTALSGTAGVFQITGDEVAFLVNPKGTKVASVNPNEKVTIAFGCQ